MFHMLSLHRSKILFRLFKSCSVKLCLLHIAYDGHWPLYWILNFKFQTQTYQINQAKCCVCESDDKRWPENFDKFHFPISCNRKIAWTFEFWIHSSQSVVGGRRTLFNYTYISLAGRRVKEKKNWIDRLKCKCQQVLQVDESFIHELVHFRSHILLMYAFPVVESYE